MVRTYAQIQYGNYNYASSPRPKAKLRARLPRIDQVQFRLRQRKPRNCLLLNENGNSLTHPRRPSKLHQSSAITSLQIVYSLGSQCGESCSLHSYLPSGFGILGFDCKNISPADRVPQARASSCRNARKSWRHCKSCCRRPTRSLGSGFGKSLKLQIFVQQEHFCQKRSRTC